MHGIDEKKAIEELKEFLKFPSISSDSSKKKEVLNCANWLYRHLKKIGLENVQLFPTALHPIVYAEQISHPSYKTILFYGHYDVQPVAPLLKWKFPPFKPVIANNYIYARGASDDKGQLFTHVKAIELALKNKSSLKSNIKCLFEGEAEIGSTHLADFISRNQKLLRCDVAVLSDTKMLSADVPAITYSLRGSLNAEIIVMGPGKELHSGTFGGMIFNPADVLCQVVGKMHDPSGRIMIPGFYSDVVQLSEAERQFMKKSGPRDDSLLKDASSRASWGEKAFSNYEKTTTRPVISITGLQSGFTGEGTKNAIPTSASVKINMRLVKNQDPKKVAALFKSFARQYIPANVIYRIKFSSFTEPVEVSRTHPFILAAAQAYKTVFNHAPVFLRSGGSIPVVSMFTYKLKVPVILMGFALAGDNMHAPNEKFYLPNLFRAIKTSFLFTKNIAAQYNDHEHAYY